MIYSHWEIRKLRVKGGEVVVGDVVAEVEAVDGTGRLMVYDEAYREVLEELFTEEQVVLLERDVSDDGMVESTHAGILPPWQPETLEYVKSRLGKYALTAVEVD